MLILTETEVYVWDLSTGRAIFRLENDTCISVALSPNGQLVAVVHPPKAVIYDVESNVEVTHFVDESITVFPALAFSPDGSFLAIGDLEIVVWSVGPGKKTGVFKGHTRRITQVLFAGDSRRLLSASEDACMCIWDVGQPSGTCAVENHKATIVCHNIGFKNGLAVTADMDGVVRLWNTMEGMQLACFHDLGHVQQVFFSVCERFLIGYGAGGIALWEISKGRLLSPVVRPGGPITAVSVSDDGGLIAVASRDRNIRLFSLPELEELMCLRGHRDMIRWLSICPGGDRLASIAYDRTVRIWDIRSMSKTTVLRMKEAPTVLPSVHFISCNRLFFRWKDDICIWDTTVEKEVARLVGNYGEMNVLGVSEDRSLIVAMYEGNHIVAWDAKAFTLVHDFKGFISCAHDIMAMFSQEPRFSLRLVPGPLDSAIVRAADNWTVGWCPQRELSVLPSGRAWMGYSGNSVNFFVLEGFSDDGRHAVEGRGYNGR